MNISSVAVGASPTNWGCCWNSTKSIFNFNLIIGGFNSKKQKQYYYYPPATSKKSIKCGINPLLATRGHQEEVVAVVVAAAAVMFLWGGAATAAVEPQAPMDTLSNIPQTLSGECAPSASGSSDCKKARRIQRPKSSKAEWCTVKCVTTCIRGGGEGPLNARRPLVVFKQGFRSRQYCLVECSDICNLISDLDSGP